MKLPKVNRIYHPYTSWECFRSGMHASVPAASMVEYKDKYLMFLSDLSVFSDGIDLVFLQWKMSCENFLTDQNINRIAWLGQASACLSIGVPRACRSAFWQLTTRQQTEANKLAFQRIRNWIVERKQDSESNKRVRSNVARQVLFEWVT